MLKKLTLIVVAGSIMAPAMAEGPSYYEQAVNYASQKTSQAGDFIALGVKKTGDKIGSGATTVWNGAKSGAQSAADSLVSAKNGVVGWTQSLATKYANTDPAAQYSKVAGSLATAFLGLGFLKYAWNKKDESTVKSLGSALAGLACCAASFKLGLDSGFFTK
ncbi:MAG: hypothetical protein AB7R69_02540 [Candidatus Babeliales bacterium]